MVEAMVLGGLRRCEVLGFRLEDFVPAKAGCSCRRAKAGINVWSRFLDGSSARWRPTSTERPAQTATDRLFVVLKGPRRGRPLSEDGLDEIVRYTRSRVGLAHCTCHELRHTCLTRLREAGMALEAIQAQAGHRSIETTRIYLHLSNEWLADEYARAISLIDHSVLEAVAQ